MQYSSQQLLITLSPQLLITIQLHISHNEIIIPKIIIILTQPNFVKFFKLFTSRSEKKKTKKKINLLHDLIQIVM